VLFRSEAVCSSDLCARSYVSLCYEVLVLIYLPYSHVIVVVVVVLSVVEMRAMIGCGIESILRKCCGIWGTYCESHFIVLLCFGTYDIVKRIVGVFALELSLMLLLMIFSHAA